MKYIEVGAGSWLKNNDGEEFVILGLMDDLSVLACIGAVVIEKYPDNQILELKVSNTTVLKNVVEKIGEVGVDEIRKAIFACKRNYSKMVIPDIIENNEDLSKLPRIRLEID